MQLSGRLVCWCRNKL